MKEIDCAPFVGAFIMRVRLHGLPHNSDGSSRHRNETTLMKLCAYISSIRMQLTW